MRTIVASAVVFSLLAFLPNCGAESSNDDEVPIAGSAGSAMDASNEHASPAGHGGTGGDASVQPEASPGGQGGGLDGSWEVGAEGATDSDSESEVEPEAQADGPDGWPQATCDDSGVIQAPPLACNAEPPPGAAQPAPLPIYNGTCPTLVPAPNSNTIVSSGADRKFLLAIPKDLSPTEKLPVIFLWHWLGGSAKSFYDKGEVQAAVDSQRFLAVLPDAKGDLPFKWPFEIYQPDFRMNEEFKFFDDMLACVAAQFPSVNRNCVSSAGVSAGALFTDQLAAGRAQYLASFISMSGGVDSGTVKPWGNPAHKLPGLVLWGGTDDFCILINFEATSNELESALVKQGNFFVECKHNCAHSEPPLEAPPCYSKYAGLWQFAFDHPFWLKPGESLYNQLGIPPSLPSWCGVGPGSAVQRVGPCGPPGCSP